MSYCIIEGDTYNLPDVQEFVGILNGLGQNSLPALRDIFKLDGELIVTRAPGRLDVMGGIADYSGSLVLELPTREATFVALQRDSAPLLRLVSLSQDPDQQPMRFEMPLSEFLINECPVSYEAARRYFGGEPQNVWAGYVAGVFLVLMRERGTVFREGVRILIRSHVPSGKGVSSSAALEVAAMQAVAAAFDIDLEPRELARLCQVVENQIVGAPCGVMDQMTSACGEKDRLLSLLCQPAELQGTLTIPTAVSFWGIDSGVRHAVTGSDYKSVRVGAFMGYRMIAELSNFKVIETETAGVLRIEDPRWGGYLANISPSEFEQTFAAALPERISGADFLRQYRGTTDRVTRVDAARTYAVRAPTAHAIHEHHRVRLFSVLLKGEIDERRLELLGELMYQSHASYSACGLGAEATDRLVAIVRNLGRANGVYGAKITGGGSGGTVAVIGRNDAASTIATAANAYALETGHHPYVFAGSSPGAAMFGTLRLSLVAGCSSH